MRLPLTSPNFSFDFGYLLKLVTCHELPATEAEFFEARPQPYLTGRLTPPLSHQLLFLYFPHVYDMKYLMKFCEGGSLHGGLQKLADALEVERIGPQHQAGSDSLLTATTFFKMRSTYFDAGSTAGKPGSGEGGLSKYLNVLYGLGVDGRSQEGVEDAD